MTALRIYVARMTAYNNGKLHGVWLDACTDVDVPPASSKIGTKVSDIHGLQLTAHACSRKGRPAGRKQNTYLIRINPCIC